MYQKLAWDSLGGGGDFPDWSGEGEIVLTLASFVVFNQLHFLNQFHPSWNGVIATRGGCGVPAQGLVSMFFICCGFITLLRRFMKSLKSFGPQRLVHTCWQQNILFEQLCLLPPVTYWVHIPAEEMGHENICSETVRDATYLYLILEL